MAESFELAALGVAPSGIVLGSGFDLRTQTVCMTATTGRLNAKPLDWQPSYDLSYMSSYESVAKFYSLDASVRYSGTGGSASASVAIVKACNLERKRIILALKVRAITGSEFIDTAELTPDALNALRALSMPTFVGRYGGSYVRKISWGGELACLLVVTASSVEKLESLRAKMEAEGYGAHGQAETKTSIAEISKANDVRVVYCQTGGGSDGKIGESNVDELITRMESFAEELRKTDPLRGQVVPLEVEYWPMTRVSNWPKEITGDPLRPYPPEIESIAATVQMYEDRLDRVNELLSKPANTIAPSSAEAARELQGYLETTIRASRDSLERLKSNANLRPTLPMESFHQCRLRRLHGVDLGDHENAGEKLDAVSADKRQLMEALIGPDFYPSIKPWPQVNIKIWWGYRGEDGGKYPGFHWRCHKKEHHDIMLEHVYPLTGKKPGVEDGIFVSNSGGPAAYRSGNACGYTPHVIVGAYVEKPDEPQLAPLPKLPSRDARIELEYRLGKPRKAGNDVWVLPFDIKVVPASSTSSYQIIVGEVSVDGGFRETVLPRSYWVAEDPGLKNFQHTYVPASGWTPKDFKLKSGPVYVS